MREESLSRSESIARTLGGWGRHSVGLSAALSSATGDIRPLLPQRRAGRGRNGSRFRRPDRVRAGEPDRRYKKIWTIEHACGHTSEVDLSDRPADRRAGYARWLTARDCPDCWRASRDQDPESKAEWLATKRAGEQAEADQWSEQYRMPPLEGTDRAVAWATRCRHQLVSAAYTTLVVEGSTSEAEWDAIEDTIRPLTRAGWWIDQRDADPADPPELLEAASASDRPNENPHF